MILLKENNGPVLCFGTFFTLLLREGVDKLSTKGIENIRQGGSKNKLTEVTAFLALNRIITPSFSPANYDTFAGQASKFKSCVSQKAKKLPIVDACEITTFLIRYETDYKTIFNHMFDFSNTYIHPDISKRERLVKSLLELIRDDKDIGMDEKFYVNGNVNILNKKELVCNRTFSFVAFLIGIFRYIVEIKRDDNIKGKSTYERWCPPANQGLRPYSKDIYIGKTIRDNINFIEDSIDILSNLMPQKTTSCDISYLMGIDRADYLKNEAKICKLNQDYKKALQLYYESWLIYIDVIGIESRCAVKVYDTMEYIYIKLDMPYSFKYWLNNIAKRGEDID